MIVLLTNIYYITSINHLLTMVYHPIATENPATIEIRSSLVKSLTTASSFTNTCHAKREGCAEAVLSRVVVPVGVGWNLGPLSSAEFGIRCTMSFLFTVKHVEIYKLQTQPAVSTATLDSTKYCLLRCCVPIVQ